MTKNAAMPIRDAITGQRCGAEAHNRHVILDTGLHTWLTPAAAIALAEQLHRTAAAVLDAAGAAR